MTLDIKNLTEIERWSIEREMVERSGADAFLYFLTFVKIEASKAQGGGLIPFDLWDFQRERAISWAEGVSEVWLKRRQVGASWLAAGLCYWMGYKGPPHIGVFSKDQKASIKFILKIKKIHNSLPEHLQMGIVNDLKEELVFENGLYITAFPSTQDAGISHTLGLIITDEAAFHKYGTENYEAYYPAIADGGQLICLSTADPKLGPNGFFFQMYQDAKSGQNPYLAVFTEAEARPDQGKEWLEATRKAYRENPELGDRAYRGYFPSVDDDAFMSQSGLVFPNFSEDRHVGPPPAAWAQCIWRGVGIDEGGVNDPHAMIPIGVTPDEKLIQYAEFVRRGLDDAGKGVSVQTYAEQLQKWGGPEMINWIEVDGSDVTVNTLIGMGYAANKATKSKTRASGKTFIDYLLDNDLLLIDPKCKQSIKEFYEYRMVIKRNPFSHDTYETSTPYDHHADCMDARRILLVAYWLGIPDEGTRQYKMAYA